MSDPNNPIQTATPPSFETVWAILHEIAENQKRTDQQMAETRLQMAETDRQMAETDRLIKENARRIAETGLQMAETRLQMAETDRRMAETDRRIAETDQLIKENARQLAETRLQIAETGLQMAETDRLIKENARHWAEISARIDEYNKRFGDITNRFGEIVEYMVVPSLLDKFEELGFVFHHAIKQSKIADKIHNIFFETDIILENGDKAILVETKSKPTTEDVQDHLKRIEKMRSYADLKGDKRSFWGAVAGVVITDNVKVYALMKGLFVIEPSGETFAITAPSSVREW